MKVIILVALLIFLGSAEVGYPVRCVEIGDSVLGTVTDCDVISDPIPFRWTATIKAKKNLKWAGLDDVTYIYSNPDQTIVGNCTLAAPLPGAINKNDNITIEQTCYRFDPPMDKYASLVILFFYTHHDTFDDVLMYNFPIPGVNND